MFAGENCALWCLVLNSCEYYITRMVVFEEFFLIVFLISSFVSFFLFLFFLFVSSPFSLSLLLSRFFSELVRHARGGSMVGGVLQKGNTIAGSGGGTIVLGTEGQTNESHVANESTG